MDKKNWTEREQKLASICFELVLTALHPEQVDSFKKMTTEERAAWVAKQLKSCGFPTLPMGANWGYLVEDDLWQKYTK